jgi:hypothetical protein
MTAESAHALVRSHVAAPTQFVTANGIRYAYRRFGAETGTPLIFLQHSPHRPTRSTPSDRKENVDCGVIPPVISAMHTA